MVKPVCMKIGDEHRYKLHWISEETTYCESKNDFFKKSRAIDHVPVLQTGPTSCRFGRHLSFLPGMEERFEMSCWEIVHVRWCSILGKWDGSILKRHFGGYFIKRPVFCARKMEKGFSVRQKGKLPPATLFSIPMSTHMHNMGTTSQTMP